MSSVSELKKFSVATIEETCENNFTIAYTKCENETTVWPGNAITNVTVILHPVHGKKIPYPDGIPPDGGTIRILEYTHLATFITFIFLFGILVLFAVGCFLFNFLFRNRR